MPIGAIVNAHRVLKPGGQLVLIVPDRERTRDRKRSLTPMCHLIADHLRPSRERDLEHYVERAQRILNDPDFGARGLSDWEQGADVQMHTFTFESFGELLEFTKPTAPFRSTWKNDGANTDECAEFYFVLQK